MQVILKNDVDHLGYAGDVVDVKKGYWRNYLRPRDLAEAATGGRIADMLAKMERRRTAEARNEDEAKELASLLNRTVLTIPAQAGTAGKLFGSVGNHDVARAIESARKLRLDPKKIALQEPIKALGTYMVPIEVFAGVRAEVKTMVVQAANDEEIARLQSEAEARESAAIAAADAAAEKAAAAAAAAEAAAADGEGEPAGEAAADGAAAEGKAVADADAAAQ